MSVHRLTSQIIKPIEQRPAIASFFSPLSLCELQAPWNFSNRAAPRRTAWFSASKTQTPWERLCFFSARWIFECGDLGLPGTARQELRATFRLSLREVARTRQIGLH